MRGQLDQPIAAGLHGSRKSLQQLRSWRHAILSFMSDGVWLEDLKSRTGTILDGQFDTIYHEHINFFSVRSMYQLARRNGLFLNHLSMPSIHGTSFVFELGLTNREDKSMFTALVREDLDITREVFDTYAYNVHNQIDSFRRSVTALQEQGKTVIGYSAPAKGMTLLNAAGVHLEYLIDDNPLKAYKKAPGVETFVFPAAKLDKETRDLHIIILAWNFYDEIAAKIKQLRPDHNDIILTPFELSQA